MADRVTAWSIEWSRLSSEEIARRVLAVFCDHCGAVEGQQCVRKNGTALQDGYRHAARMQKAVFLFNREQRRESV